MALAPANLRRNPAPAVSELVPETLFDPTDVAIHQSSLVSGWWRANKGMMEGVADGSVLPFRLKSYKDLQALAPGVTAKPPIIANDPVISRDYLQMGYGTGLERRELDAVDFRVQAGGSGYVNSETITFQNGVVIQLAIGGHTAGAVNGQWTILDYGEFESHPTSALTQVSTTGSGTGCTINPMFLADNGSLQLQPIPGIIPALPFSTITAVRIPVVGGVAGADPGGFIMGPQLNQCEIFGGANNRWWGLRQGSATLGANKLISHISGDGKYILSSGTYDYRDGLWHVVMQTFVAGAQGSCKLWIDGTLNASDAIGGTLSALNVTVGTDMVRLGAAGLPTQGPVEGFAGDIGEMMIVQADLNHADNTALRQLILNRFLKLWRGGGASA